MMIHTARTRWLDGTVMLAAMVVLLTGCNLISFTRTYETSTDYRSPETFAAGCAEIGGTLVEVAETDQENARSDCAMANGDNLTCDWTDQRCSGECFTSEELCESTVQYMGYEPPWKVEAPVSETPAPAEAAFGGASSHHLAGDA